MLLTGQKSGLYSSYTQYSIKTIWHVIISDKAAKFECCCHWRSSMEIIDIRSYGVVGFRAFSCCFILDSVSTFRGVYKIIITGISL